MISPYCLCNPASRVERVVTFNTNPLVPAEWQQRALPDVCDTRNV
jgi:hypothetical protein